MKQRTHRLSILDTARPVLLALLFILLTGTTSWSAVGCDLNDPDRDVARLFPESTGYKTIYTSILKKGGDKLLAVVERRLGDKFHGLYETIDVPYTIYEIFKDKKKIGYIHGVNQKGQFGGIQVFLVQNLEGTIRGFYIQRMTSRYAGKLRDAKFGKQFVGLTLKDFDHYDVVSGKAKGKVEAIKNPAPEAETDFRAALRATKKNLILMDEFVFASSGGASAAKEPKR
ncbi:MAG: hypothetical protein PHN75_02585 [Syntrophales bacterium]|nr:hypothetical protein [Syntrophales bacterium]